MKYDIVDEGLMWLYNHIGWVGIIILFIGIFVIEWVLTNMGRD